MDQSVFTHAHAVVRELLTNRIEIFWGMGNKLAYALSVTLIAWFGIQTALSGKGVQWDKFIKLMMQIATCMAMIQFYYKPLWGEYSFISLITKQFDHMTDVLGFHTLSVMSQQIAKFSASMPFSSSLFDFYGAIISIAVSSTMSLVMTLAFAVSIWGVVAQSIIIMLGPVFVPFFIVPKLDFLFWSWFRSLLIYSSYQVVAAAVIYVFGQLYMTLMQFNPDVPVTMDKLHNDWFSYVIAAFVCCFGFLQIPSLASSLFSGGGGGSVVGDVMRAANTVKQVGMSVGSNVAKVAAGAATGGAAALAGGVGKMSVKIPFMGEYSSKPANPYFGHNLKRAADINKRGGGSRKGGRS